MTQRPPAAEIEATFRRFRETGRRRDRNMLVEAHIGFAHHVAQRYRERGIADEDLRQTALLALVKAVDRFDPDLGTSFTSFAGPTIEGELKRWFRDRSWAVKVPRSAKELHLAVRRASDELGQTLGHSPTPREVAAHLDISVQDVVTAMVASNAYNADSIDGTPSDDAPVRASRAVRVDDDLDAVDDRMLIDELLEQLPDREREIVRLRFYDRLTQSEIADRMGISQMHVSRLLRQSFEVMRGAAD